MTRLSAIHPFVRYQSFAGDFLVKALKAALAQGVRLTGLASSWAAFAVHAIGHLKPGGRLALVLPAELLTVGYAAQVVISSTRWFSSVRLVVFEQLVFEDALEEVVLLLAEGNGGATHFKVYQAKNAAILRERRYGRLDGSPTEAKRQVDLSPSLFAGHGALRRVLVDFAFRTAGLLGLPYLGAVTGATMPISPFRRAMPWQRDCPPRTCGQSRHRDQGTFEG